MGLGFCIAPYLNGAVVSLLSIQQKKIEINKEDETKMANKILCEIQPKKKTPVAHDICGSN